MAKTHLIPSVIPVVATVVISAVGIMGCSKPSEDAKPPLPKFEISGADNEKLEKVGCYVRSPNVECSSVIGQLATNELNLYMSSQSEAKRQKAVLDEVNASIKAALKAGSYEAGSVTEAELILLSLDVNSARLTVEIADLDTKILNEKNYQTVLGYRCEGSYLRDGNKLKTKTDLFSTAPNEPKLVRDDNASYVSTLELRDTDPALSYKLTDHPKADQQNLRQSVQMDGEFTARSFEKAMGTMNCARTRLYGSTFPFSDRVRSTTYYQCQAVSHFNGKETKWNQSFPVTSGTDENSVEFVIESMDEEMNIRPEGRVAFQKYMARASWSKGLLKFTFENLVTKSPVMEVTTTNATNSLRLDVDDNKGNSLTILCGVQKD